MPRRAYSKRLSSHVRRVRVMTCTTGRLVCGYALSVVFASLSPAWAAPAPCELSGEPAPFPALQLQSLVTDLDEPTGLYHAGDGSGRLFILEQAGKIVVWQGGTLNKKPFLDIRKRVASGGELGLLGLAFHPRFAQNRRLFVNYTSRDGGLHTVISEFTANKDGQTVDANSERILLTVDQPYSNHNGGQTSFGSDGMLYIALGDGGAGNDPHNNGQKLSTLLGKILRIDVDRSQGKTPYAIPADNPFIAEGSPEIWAYGLRNPWRFSFDPVTGLLYVADVGQGAREEINLVVKGGNYGWNIMEGSICTPKVNKNCDQKGLLQPLTDYRRSEGTTVIGGYVYRGHAIPDLCGAYLYGDYGSGKIFGLRHRDQVFAQKTLLESGRSISSFGEDEQRELYVVDHGGEVLKIVPQR